MSVCKYRHSTAGAENAGVDISGVNDGAEHAELPRILCPGDKKVNHPNEAVLSRPKLHTLQPEFQPTNVMTCFAS